jgi:2-dehydropantoate 2-reductase
MTRLRLLRGPLHETFSFDGVLSAEQARAQAPCDAVWLALPSDALGGAWLRALAPAFASATVVSLLPGLGDAAALAQLGVEPERLVRGLIALIAFQEPLVPGQAGTAYFLPPMLPTHFDGPRARVAQVVAALRAGGVAAQHSPMGLRRSPFLTAALMAHIASLEGAGWSLEAFLRKGALRASAHAAAQAMELAALTEGPLPMMPPMAWPLFLSVALRLGRRFAPFPLEAYLKFHFSKVGAQTRFLLRGLAEAGAARGVANAAVAALAQGAPASAPPTRS